MSMSVLVQSVPATSEEELHRIVEQAKAGDREAFG